MLLVALSMERQETLGRTRVQALRGRERSIVYRYQRRSLVIPPIECAQHPPEMGDLDGCSDARVGGVLHDRTPVMSQAQPAVKRQPVCGLELLFAECGLGIRPRSRAEGQDGIRAGGRNGADRIKLVVPLSEGLDSGVKIVPAAGNRNRAHAAAIIRAAVVVRGQGVALPRDVVS